MTRSLFWVSWKRVNRFTTFLIYLESMLLLNVNKVNALYASTLRTIRNYSKKIRLVED